MDFIDGHGLFGTSGAAAETRKEGFLFLLHLESTCARVSLMSVGEIKQEASRLGAEDVIHLAAWFHHLARQKDPAYLKSLDEAFDSIDGGDRMSLHDYKNLTGELEKSGM